MSDLINNAAMATVTFNAAMAELFPTFITGSAVRSNLGPHIVVEFANVSDAKEAPNGILMNATGHMRFMMHLTNNFGTTLPDGSPVSVELLTWSIPRKYEAIKFRKINGKTPADAMVKLVKWFEKNADAIRSL